MSVNLNAWLSVAAACWLFLRFAPSVSWLPSWINGYVVMIGALACLLVIVTEVLPIVRGAIESALSRRKS